MTEYEFWLKSVRKCDYNSMMKCLANFKKIVIRCLKNGWLKQNPFIGFKLTKREVERIALTQNEVARNALEVFPMEGTSIFIKCKVRVVAGPQLQVTATTKGNI